MSELRLYDVTVGKHKTRMRLDDDDAQRLGGDAVPVEQPRTPPAGPPVDGKARLATANKVRTSEPGAGRRGDSE